MTSVIATVTSVRRIAAILALVAALWAHSPPAWAHPGTTNFKVPVGKRVTITLVVTADEDSQVTAVDIGIDPQFRLDAVAPAPGWQSARANSVVHYTGGSIPGNQLALFSLTGLVAQKAALVFSITTHAASGAVRVFDGGPGHANQGAVIYAGINPPGSGGGGGGGNPATTVLGIGGGIVSR